MAKAVTGKWFLSSSRVTMESLPPPMGMRIDCDLAGFGKKEEGEEAALGEVKVRKSEAVKSILFL